MFVAPIFAAEVRAASRWDAASRLRLIRHQCSVGALSKVIARALGLDQAHCHRLGRAASLHDVGKFYVAASISQKCGTLNGPEVLALQQHTIFGHAHLRAVQQTPVVQLAAKIALQHHERWDGTGYPFGLCGEQISLESRIVSVCDVYDALREERSYRTGICHDAALEVITCGDDRTRPSMFDPEVVNAMLACREEIQSVFNDRHLDNCATKPAANGAQSSLVNQRLPMRAARP